jgi:hypothetical protein
MRRRTLLLVIALLPFIWPVTPAAARTGCDAAPGTAAADQYCETLPTADGMTDATAEHALPLARVLPAELVRRLQRSGLLGEVLLALPAGARGSGSPAAERAAREAAADPRLGALAPGKPRDDGSALQSSMSAAGEVGQGFAWTLVVALLTVGAVSLLRSARSWSLR